ncbi:MAG: hypothetical protein V1494_06905 [Candidatus Diapherotrites archaeon]
MKKALFEYYLMDNNYQNRTRVNDIQARISHEIYLEVSEKIKEGDISKAKELFLENFRLIIHEISQFGGIKERKHLFGRVAQGINFLKDTYFFDIKYGEINDAKKELFTIFNEHLVVVIALILKDEEDFGAIEYIDRMIHPLFYIEKRDAPDYAGFTVSRVDEKYFFDVFRFRFKNASKDYDELKFEIEKYKNWVEEKNKKFADLLKNRGINAEYKKAKE